MNKEEFINSKMKLSKEDIIYDYYEVEEKLIEKLGIEHENYKLQEENQKLKKQLEEKENIACNWKDSCLENAVKIEILETQQKEFIKYLEDLIKQNETVVEVSKYGLHKNCSKLLIDFYKEILKKYKSIIGVENDND